MIQSGIYFFYPLKYSLHERIQYLFVPDIVHGTRERNYSQNKPMARERNYSQNRPKS